MTDLVTPMIQVRHDSAICYDLWTGARKAPEQHDSYLQKARALTYSGVVTPGAEKRIRKAIDLLLQASPPTLIYNTVSNSYHPFSIGFWTLTVSDRVIRPHSEVVKTCLAPFLDWLRSKKSLYLWKAELQSRGQVHYHLTINQFIPWDHAAKHWNKQQRKAGYLEAYAKEHKHYNPNSIDVHAVRNLKDIEAYLVKYIVKNDPTQKIAHGKIWGCSSVLNGSRFSTEIDSVIESKIRASAATYLEYCTVVKTPGRNLLSQTTNQEYQQFLSKIKK